MKLYAFILALAFALPAAAGGDHEDHNNHGGDPSVSTPQQSQSQSNKQAQDQDQQQGQKQSQSSKSRSSSNSSSESNSNSTSDSNANNTGNAQSTSVTSISPKAPVNTAVAGLGETTAGCRYHDGGGVQLAGVGLSLGKSRKDGDCERLKLAEFLYQRGNDIAGDRVMCNIKAIKEALGDDCIALVHELKPAPAPGGSTYVTKPELDNALRSASQK